MYNATWSTEKKIAHLKAKEEGRKKFRGPSIKIQVLQEFVEASQQGKKS